MSTSPHLAIIPAQPLSQHPKPKKLAYDTPKAFWPITLLNVLSKLLTKILAQRMQFEGQAHGLFHEGQLGGVSKHATMDVGLILVDIITENHDWGLHTSVLALDIAQFFPSINHSVLCTLLTKLGFNHKLTTLLASFLKDRTTTYKWDGISTTTHFQCSEGIPQGDPLSLILSALYLALIIHYHFLWDTDKWVNSLFYVDDGTLVCSSPSLDNNVTLLSILYKHFLCLLANIGLTVEQTKLELKHFIAYNLSGPKCSFVVINQPSLRYTWQGVEYDIKPQETWRYLGFFFDSYLKFDFHVRYYTNKGFSTIHACNMLGKLCGGLGPRQRVICYNAYVIPVLTYGMPLWYAEDGKGCLKNLRKMVCVQSYATRWITGAFRGMPVGATEMLSGVPPLQLKCNLMLKGYVAWIHTLPHDHLLRKAWIGNNLPDWLRDFQPR